MAAHWLAAKARLRIVPMWIELVGPAGHFTIEIIG
jgi:hypothetical protein